MLSTPFRDLCRARDTMFPSLEDVIVLEDSDLSMRKYRVVAFLKFAILATVNFVNALNRACSISFSNEM